MFTEGNLQPSHTRCHSTGTSHSKEVLGHGGSSATADRRAALLGALALGQERVSVSDCSREAPSLSDGARRLAGDVDQSQMQHMPSPNAPTARQCA